MTPQRLAFLIDHCLRRRRAASLSASHAYIARLLDITPATLRRYLKGERPIPPRVETILEILHAYPDVTADVIDQLIAKANFP
jgi:predicted transcriptional regulator